METKSMEKPRLSYADFLATRNAITTKGTVAWVLDRYYKEFAHRILHSQMYTIRRLQKSPHIGQKVALKLTKVNIFEHVNARLAAGIKPQTINQDITYLRVALKYAGSAWEDCDGITDAAVTAALPFMKTQGMVGKAPARDRLPQDQEIALLRAHFRKQAQHRNTKLPMERLMDWQIVSGRRIGETCMLLWVDWAREKQTILVRKMKANKKPRAVALPDEAQAMLEAMWAALPEETRQLVATLEVNDPKQPRIYPYNAKSVGASYTRAKNDLEIVDLRLHDSRAKCYTTMREKGIPASIAILVTGHKAEALPERVYKRMNADQFKELQNVRVAA